METRWVYLCVLMLGTGYGLASTPFSFEQVRQQAELLAQRPYVKPGRAVPLSLSSLTYSAYQSIRFNEQAALWATEGLPFQVDFFLPGFFHKQRVRIAEVRPREVSRVPFLADAFLLGTNRVEIPPDFDYAGFRIIQARPPRAEIAAFLDASYFRMVGLGASFGASARGLALNTVLREKEEFPEFREFWLRKPEPHDKAMVVWALLDSVSVAGAFEFEIRPGEDTVAHIRTSFYPRIEIKEFGVAPLTSMFLYDQNSRPPNRDFRPEVHDSDGLLLRTSGGQWIWRPLERGRMMRVNAYSDTSLKGFGLIQRDRDFEHYQDLVGRFEERPNLWVEPDGEWGRGHVELIQLPTDIEFMDNTVAFWVPALAPRAGQRVEWAYNLHWLTNEIGSPTLGKVRDMRLGEITAIPGHESNLRFVIDFDGVVLQRLSASEQIDAEVECGDGAKFIADTVQKNEVNGTWRLVVEISPPTKAVDLRACLKRATHPVTETWTYTWQP